MNRNRTIRRQWLGAVLAAVIIAAAVPATAWAQTGTNQGVRVKTATGETTTNVTSVASEDKDGTATSATPEGTNTTVSDGTIITAGHAKTVTVTTTGPRVNSATGKMQVAKVKVTKKEDFLATGITITSAEGDVTTMNGNATLQMTANFSPTYTDNKTVEWSVASATGSSATATIDASTGLLRAGTVQGDVVVTATATNGTEDVTDDVVNTKTITITTIPLTYTAPTFVSSALTYNGSGQALVTGGSVEGGTLSYSYRFKTHGGSYGSWSEWGSAPTGTNAGIYEVKYKVEPDAGYTGGIGETSLGEFTINKANGWVTLSKTSSTGWSSSAPNNTFFTISHHGGAITWTKNGSNSSWLDVSYNSNNNTYNLHKEAFVNVVGVTVTFTSAETNNYNAASATHTCN